MGLLWKNACTVLPVIRFILILVVILNCKLLAANIQQLTHADFSSTGVIGVRFDPSYYYSIKQPLNRFADSTAQLWAHAGINCVFFMGYDPQYGAFYKTSYTCNIMGDFGKQDLMGLVLAACHARGIKMMVWLWPYQHGGAWKEHPQWRVKKRGNSDLQALKGRNLLCLSHNDCRAWWNGFVADILSNYPSVDGIDVAEPAVVWDGQYTCACSECRNKILIPAGKHIIRRQQLRANGLSDALAQCAEQIHKNHKTFCLTFTGTANRQGMLFPFSKQVEFTGIDVAALFSYREHPDWVSVEMLWQEWAEAYGNFHIFTPQWTAAATAQAKAQIGDKALFIAHVELGNSGKVSVSADDFLQSVKAAREAGAPSLEFYDAFLADSLRIWPKLRSILHEPSKRRALIFYDTRGHAEARELELLCGHFDVQTEVHPVASFSSEYVNALDHVFYVGTDYGAVLPPAFISFARNPPVPIFWINYNIEQVVTKNFVIPHVDTGFTEDEVDTSFAALYSDIPFWKPHFQEVAGYSNEPIVSNLWDSTRIFQKTAPWFDADVDTKHAPEKPMANRAVDQDPGFRKIGLSFDGYDTVGTFRSVLYKGKLFNKFDSTLCMFSHVDTSCIKVYAWAIAKSGERRPYILRAGKLWYSADYSFSQLEGDRAIVVADLLHDFFNEDHPQRHTALVRIEDVNPQSDPNQIRALADFFSSEKIPWSISLVPFYYNPKENSAHALCDNPEMVSALHYAVDHGAAIVQHGVTHQYRGHTTADYEFWDIENNRPVFEDSPEYVSTKLQRGLDELHKAGLYPVCFEMPHYGGSQLDYGVINRFFSTEYGRRLVVDTLGYEVFAPYAIFRFPGSGAIIPENCGYIPNDKLDSRPIIDAARSNLAIRDGFASFFYHPWIDRNVLEKIIREIRLMGYSFADIRDIPLTVSGRGFVQCTDDQRIAIKLSNQYLHTFYLDNSGKKWDEQTSINLSHSIDTLSVSCPRGKMFVAEAVSKRPPAFVFPRIPLPTLGWWNYLTSWITRRPELSLWSGIPATIAIVRDTARALGKQNGYEGTDSAWKKAFVYFGMDVSFIDIRSLNGIPDGVNLLVMSSAAQSALTLEQCRRVSEDVRQGKNIIIEGSGTLCASLGLFSDTSRRTLRSVVDSKYPNVKISWRMPESIFQTLPVRGVVDTHYVSGDGAAVVTSGSVDKGKYLLCRAHIAEPGSTEPTRFPFLVNCIQQTFNLVPVVRSPLVELYFKPTFRHFISQDAIVGVWRKNGVRAVYVAFNEDYFTHEIEYSRLVKLLHDNGIIAYAWFDFPRVEQPFWDGHVMWREKAASPSATQRGQTTYSVNLVDPQCRKEIMRRARGFLAVTKWDGFNWTGPMNYGDSLNRLITRQFIDSLRGGFFAAESPEIILSRPLAGLSENMRSFYLNFVSVGSIVRLQAQLPVGQGLNGVTLDSLCTQMLTKFPQWKPMVELNFENVLPKSGTTRQLLGLELMGILAHAAAHDIRLTLRSDANVCEVDFGNLSYAFASASKQGFGLSKWSMNAQGPLEMDFDPRINGQLRIDGQLWPANGEGRLLFPRGQHTIEGCSRLLAWRSMLNDPIHISGFTGTIENAVSTFRGLDLKYSADTRAIVSFSRRPMRLLIDGVERDDVLAETFGTAENNQSTCILPAGTHYVRVFTGSLFASIMELISMRLSLAIIVVSSISIAAFLILYALERAGLSLIGKLLQRKRISAEGGMQ